MKAPMLLGILGFLVFAAIGVYYLIPLPGQAHILASKIDTSDVKHALAFFAAAVVALIAGRFASNSSARSAR